MRQPGSRMYSHTRLDRARGFTLLEVLAALAVMSVAIYILISMFLASLQVGEGARLQASAAAIAKEQMQALVQAPHTFEWPPFVGDGEAVEILPALEADEWHSTILPDAMPAVAGSFARETTYHERFGWRAYARPLEDAPSVVEVSVVVKWTLGGRPQSFVLTSAMPRGSVPGGEGEA